MKTLLVAAALMTCLSQTAMAQHHHQAPYAGQQQRHIKALSDQQLDDLRAGRGMSLALAGELNGYPGPLHVLELADQLTLTRDQRRHVEVLLKDMKAEAIEAGQRLIVEERALDQAFARREISADTLAAMTSRIGQAQGDLRAVHLKYHLSTALLLSDHQRHQYAMLRGYR